MTANHLRRTALAITVAAVVSTILPALPAAATVPCRTIVGPVMYGLGTGPEYGACVNVIAGNNPGNSLTVMAGANPTDSRLPAYVLVSDSICSTAFCVFAGAGVTKSGASVGPVAYVCYIDQLGNGFCVPDLDPAALDSVLSSVDLDTGLISQVKAAIADLDTRMV